MGQLLQRLQDTGLVFSEEPSQGLNTVKFPDLSILPPEISLLVLSNLDATDLCLAACVWSKLGNDEVLWQSLCKTSWGCVSIYRQARKDGTFSYRKLYLVLDEASLTFNADPFDGVDYLIRCGLVEDCPMEIAKFLHTTKKIKPSPKRAFLEKRPDVLDCVMQIQNFGNQFLPNAMRKLFQHISAPSERGSYLEQIIDRFAGRFCSCNPHLGLEKDAVYVLCFSLIMLSVDLTSPHVKNKMSKREFIKNTRRAASGVSEDLVGDLYDNVYLVGHVAAS
ncbi:FBX8-like protein [Mya arenaria]|uniref:FBX8-like protein n=1 Tax=Mya arenaria TaxID=6604 RepID=A0ABY7DP85_MYAAR|nr:F-box only protein 8-like [Mya arenaria]WAQ99502.1 FBX8-like protein [Mya arenaria]